MKTALEVGSALIAAEEVEPMSESATETMLTLIVAGDAFRIPAGVELPLGLKIAQKRAEAFGVPATDAALVMVAALCDRPGTVVMYVAVLAALAARLGRAATVSDLAEAFPVGFPKDVALYRVWDAQTRVGPDRPSGSDNWLDYPEAWK